MARALAAPLRSGHTGLPSDHGDYVYRVPHWQDLPELAAPPNVDDRIRAQVRRLSDRI